jgi:hypothetical protein
LLRTTQHRADFESDSFNFESHVADMLQSSCWNFLKGDSLIRSCQNF